jgi:hypothetical protein
MLTNRTLFDQPHRDLHRSPTCLIDCSALFAFREER